MTIHRGAPAASIGPDRRAPITIASQPGALWTCPVTGADCRELRGAALALWVANPWEMRAQAYAAAGVVARSRSTIVLNCDDQDVVDRLLDAAPPRLHRVLAHRLAHLIDALLVRRRTLR